MDFYNSKANIKSGLSYFIFHFILTPSTYLHRFTSLSGPLMLGAAASTFYINDAATIMPRALVARTSAYLAGAAADVLEV